MAVKDAESDVFLHSHPDACLAMRDWDELLMWNGTLGRCDSTHPSRSTKHPHSSQ